MPRQATAVMHVKQVTGFPSWAICTLKAAAWLSDSRVGEHQGLHASTARVHPCQSIESRSAVICYNSQAVRVKLASVYHHGCLLRAPVQQRLCSFAPT